MTTPDDERDKKLARPLALRILMAPSRPVIEETVEHLTFLLAAFRAEARKEAEEVRDRAVRRLVEVTAPGSIGAFAARDVALERAESLCAERDSNDERCFRIIGGLTERAEAAERSLAEARDRLLRIAALPWDAKPRSLEALSDEARKIAKGEK